ncbi:Protein FAM220A [Apodemus speciosus]|uniref:Protein FAM220A n=1 Tax=Apodemus speciosus TaxID=105296 RepID=A0ABQ0ETR1_APOSI
MRPGTGTLGVCLARVKQLQGGDLDRLAYGLKKRSQKGHPSPSDVPFWTDQPIADTHGKSPAMAAASAMKQDESKASRVLHGGFKEPQSLKGSVRRSSAPAASLGKTVALSSAPSEPGVSRDIGDALRSDWPGRGLRATHSRGQNLKGESWVSGWPGHPRLRGMGFLRGGPLSAVPKGLGTGSELSCRYSELCQLPYAHTHYEVLPEDKMRFVSLDRLNPVFSEEKVEDEKPLSSTSGGLQIVVGSLALQSSRLASL